MKHLSVILFSLSLSACNLINLADFKCPGNTELPEEFTGFFEPIEDEILLESSIDMSMKGKLCQGKVYRAKKDVDIPIYSAWNSTNPNSRFGQWWSFKRPEGKISQYRNDFESCYQFSPLDKLTSCNIKEGAKLVVGTGQSVKCSENVIYTTSANQKIYIEDAASLMSNCTDFDGQFSWSPSNK